MAAIGIGLTVTPIVALLLHHYDLAVMAIALLLVGPYFGFLGYGVVWQTLFGSAPPMPRGLSTAAAWAWSRLDRNL
jgi:hypothetical protein